MQSKKALSGIVPELQDDSLRQMRDIQYILNDPLRVLDDPLLNKNKAIEAAKNDGITPKTSKPETGSSIMLQLGEERRGLIRDKYYKRIGEE